MHLLSHYDVSGQGEGVIQRKGAAVFRLPWDFPHRACRDRQRARQPDEIIERQRECRHPF